MSVRIGSNASSLMVQRNLADGSSKVSSSFERLSSGLRINQASDDAASLAIANTLDAHAKVFAQGTKNLNDSISLYAIQKSATEELTNISLRQRELSEQAASGSYTDTQRDALNQEGRDLTNEYNRIVKTTSYNGKSIFADPYEDLRTQCGIGAESSIAQKLADELSTKATGGSYFLINTPNVEYYVWFTVDGVGTDPKLTNTALQGKTGKKVDLYSDPSQTQQEITNLTFNAGTTISAASSFLIYSGKNTYQVSFKKDGVCSLSASNTLAEATQVQVSISSSDTAEQVKLAVQNALSQASGEDFSLASGGDGILQVTTNDKVNAHSLWVTAGTIFSATSVVQEGKNGFSAESIAMAVRNVLGADQMTLLSRTQMKMTVLDGGILQIDNLQAGIVSGSDAETFGTVVIDTNNIGTGRSLYATSMGFSNVMLEDLNNDGLKDMIASPLGTSSQLNVRLNEGGGVFGSNAVYSMGGTISNCYLEDVNNDGWKDIVTAEEATDTVSVRLNLGEGVFGNRTVYSMGDQCQNAYMEDVNNDGLKDLIADNIMSGSVSVRLNQGGGAFGGQTAYTMGSLCYNSYFQDVNNDGQKDIVSMSSSGSVGVRLNQGSGSFGNLTQYTMGGVGYNAILEDINGDGLLDVLTANQASNSVGVRLNQGSGTFGNLTSYAMGGCCHNVYLEDINNDGRKDMITGNATANSVSVRFGQAGGTFGSQSVYGMGYYPEEVYFEDLNNDGFKDLVTADFQGGSLSIRMNQGNGTFGAQSVFTTGSLTYGAYIKDVNNDGLKDLVATSTNNGTMSVILNKGGGVFGNQVDYTMGAGCGGYACVEDINSDGKVDVVTADYTDRIVSVRINNGNGTFGGDGGNGSTGEKVSKTTLYFGDGRGICQVNQIDLSTKTGAKKAMQILDQRLERLSQQTSSIGTVESRLEIAVENMSSARENYLSAHDSIMDADLAQESAVVIKGRILEDVGAAMLAQANQMPKIVLQLLGGSSGIKGLGKAK